MSKIFDFLINSVRWLVAAYLIYATPALLMSYSYFNFHSHKYYYLLIGIGFYVFTIVFAGYNIRESMQIIAHELTHTLFALLTFHPVYGIRLNPDESGGSMILKGKGNWLITLAPYFFPLFAFIYMLIFPILAANIFGFGKIIIYAVLGYFLAYYWSTVISQVHPQQTDIIKEGYYFSAIIIIGGNLYSTGIILAFCSKMWKGVFMYIDLINKINMDNYKYLTDLVLQNF